MALLSESDYDLTLMAPVCRMEGCDTAGAMREASSMSASPPRQRSGDHSVPSTAAAVARLCLIAAVVGFALSALAQAPSSSPSNENAAPQNSTAAPQNTTPAAASQSANTAEITTRQETDSTFKVNVNLVVVRVVVRDKQGLAIGTLKKEDFQLFDNGKQQTIARFAVEQSANSLPPGGTGGKDQAGAKPEAPERYIAYLFDDIHLTAPDVSLVRDATNRNLAKMGPADRAAIYTTSGQTMLDFTDDQAKLHDALARLQPRPVTSGDQITQCPYMTFYLADQIVNQNNGQALTLAADNVLHCYFNGDPKYQQSALQQAQSTARMVQDQGETETRLALGTLRDVVRRVGSAPGQRTVILVSPGFLTSQVHQEADSIIERALRESIIVSTLDARGLYIGTAVQDISQTGAPNPSMDGWRMQFRAQSDSAQAEILSEFAYATGGSFFHNSNDLQEGFRRATEAPEYFYVLGFAPQNLKNDGKYHTLKVTLSNRQPYSLQARKGYYAPTHLQNAAEQAKSDINDAVFSQDERKDVPLEVHTKYFKTSDTDAKLAVLVKVDVRHLHYQKVDGRNRNDLIIVSALFDRNGNFIQGDQKTLEMRLTDETLEKKLAQGVTMRANFDVKPGAYLVRCVVRDNQGELSAANDSVDIP